VAPGRYSAAPDPLVGLKGTGPTFKVNEEKTREARSQTEI